MGPSIQPCWSGPYVELRHQRLAGQKDEGVYLSVCELNFLKNKELTI